MLEQAAGDLAEASAHLRQLEAELAAGKRESLDLRKRLEELADRDFSLGIEIADARDSIVRIAMSRSHG